MNIFGCCPKKPKKSLDYIIKWVEETDSILKEAIKWIDSIKKGDLKPIFDAYAASYPWDTLPIFDTKADKVENSTEGNLAALNGEGNIIDSSYKASDFADANHSHNGINLGGNSKNHILIEEENLIGRFHVQLWDNQEEESAFSDYITAPMLLNTFYPAITPGQGNQKLITSGAVYTALQGKADSAHTHSGIEDVVENTQSAKLYANNQSQGEPAITIELTDNTAPGANPVTKTANIDIDTIDNLNRALTDPVKASDLQPVYNDNKLITSKAVYDALLGKMPYYNGVIKIAHVDNTDSGGNGYPINSEIRASINAFINAAIDRTYMACRVELDNTDYVLQDKVIVPAIAIFEEGQGRGEWDIDVCLANGVTFSTGSQLDQPIDYWVKKASGFFS